MTHLTKRNGVYYFRRKIPLELRQLYAGKAEIIFSLQTKNRPDAEALARKHGVMFDDEFSEARANVLRATNTVSAELTPADAQERKPRLSDGLTIADADKLASMYLQRMRKQREQALEAGPHAYRNFLAALGNAKADYKEYAATGIHPFDDEPLPLWQAEAIARAAKALIKGRDLPYRNDSPFTNPPLSFDTPHKRVSLDELVERWARERKPSARTVTYYKRAVAKLKEHLKVDYIDQLTKPHLAIYKDKLLEEGITTVTTNIYLSNLSTLFNYAISNAIIETNPAQGIRVQVDENDTIKRQPFTIEQLNAFFSSPIYSDSYRPTGGKGEAGYWLPLVGLFTGARLDELCQLNKSDVRQEHYHDAQQQQQCWVVEFTDAGEGQKLKNSKSRRRIPIHPVLIELGFIQFVEASPGPRVFHELTASKAYDSISASWSKWFGRYLKQIGLKTESLVFHSFRHSFKFYARLNSITDNVQYALLGHSSGNVGDDYGGSVYPLAPLVDAMNKYQIPQLRLPTLK